MSLILHLSWTRWSSQECFLIFQLNTSHSSQGRSVEHLIDAFKSIETSCPGFSDSFVEKIVDNVRRSKR